MSANRPEACKANKPLHREKVRWVFWCPFSRTFRPWPSEAASPVNSSGSEETLFLTKGGLVCPFFLSSKSVKSPKPTLSVGRRKNRGKKRKETIVLLLRAFSKSDKGEIWL